jgi:hypothetical protein
MRGSHPFVSWELALIKSLRHVSYTRFRVLRFRTKKPKWANLDCSLGYKWLQRTSETQFLPDKKLLARPGSSFGIGNRKTICQIFRDSGCGSRIHSRAQEDGVDPISGAVDRREARVGLDPPITTLRAGATIGRVESLFDAPASPSHFVDTRAL